MMERAKFQIKTMLIETELPHHEFTDWEEKFLESLAERLELNPDYQLSKKQIAVIERIWKERQNG